MEDDDAQTKDTTTRPGELRKSDFAVVVAMSPIFLTSREAARSLGMSLDLFRDCAKAYDYEPNVCSHKIGLWRPERLLLLSNAIEKNGIPKREAKKGAAPHV